MSSVASKYETFTAQLDDYALNILDITNTYSHVLHKHEFILTDGAVIDNMGRRPQEFKFKTYWFGSKEEYNDKLSPTYANHFLFLDTIGDSNKSFTFTHPKYGEIQGYVESYSVLHDDTQQYAIIDIMFVEKDLQNQHISAVNTGNLYSMQVELLNAEIAKTGSQFQSNGFGALLGKAVDFSKDLNSQFTNLTTPVRNFLKACDVFLGQNDQFLSNITQPAVTIDSLVSYGSDIPSRMISSLNGAANRILGSIDHLSNLPAQQINSMIAQSIALSNTVGSGYNGLFQSHVLIICAGGIAAQVGSIMQTDDNNRKLALKQESKQAFDASGNRINTVVIPLLLSALEIEGIIYNIRNLIQSILKIDRDNPQLIDMSNLLIKYVDNIKLKKIEQAGITVNNIPLHLLCMQLGLPYNAADRLYALNPGILNPTFTEGKIQIYVS